MSDEIVRVRALLAGRVQHVGFRAWACDQAERLGLTGTVENLLDGRVEVVFQGKRDCVDEMKVKLKRGPTMALVRQAIFYNEKVVENETNFGSIWW